MEDLKTKKSLVKTVFYFICIFIITGLITFVLVMNRMNKTVILVDGNSMYPTLHNHEVLIANQLKDKDIINRWDIVVFKRPNGELLIKRAVGLPNERIDYINEILYIGTDIIKDEYGKGKTGNTGMLLKNDEYFCIGDNRENSSDSRKFGAIKRKDIIAIIHK